MPEATGPRMLVAALRSTVKEPVSRSAMVAKMLLGLSISEIHFVAPPVAGAGRFRLPLAVTRKFRLCLHPSGMLRVQSLHLPSKEGLARRCLPSVSLLQNFTMDNQIISTIIHLEMCGKRRREVSQLDKEKSVARPEVRRERDCITIRFGETAITLTCGHINMESNKNRPDFLSTDDSNK